jgi:hypothetical protein
MRSRFKNIILNASRQSGKSQTTAILALWHALFVPESLILVLAPALRQSQELFQKILGALRDLGTGIPVSPSAERRLSLDLENGSRILTLPGSEKTIRGFSAVSLLIMDEASRVPDELYFAVRPMLAEGLQLWDVLRRELLNFRRKQNIVTAHISYEHWRESDHDDLVLAAALACWKATYKRKGTTKLRVIR